MLFLHIKRCTVFGIKHRKQITPKLLQQTKTDTDSCQFCTGCEILRQLRPRVVCMFDKCGKNTVTNVEKILLYKSILLAIFPLFHVCQDKTVKPCFCLVDFVPWMTVPHINRYSKSLTIDKQHYKVADFVHVHVDTY